MRRHGVLAALLCTVLVLLGTGCTAEPAPPEGTAAAFLEALGRRDAQAAAATTDAPAAAAAVIGQALTALQPESVATTTQQIQRTGETATVGFDATWTLPERRVWSYSGQLPMTLTGDGWRIRWSPADLHPQLGANQTLDLTTQPAPIASVLDRRGGPVLAPASLVRVTLDPAAAGDVPAVATALAQALGPLDPSITRQSILAGVGKEPAAPLVVARLRDTDYQAVKPAIHELPGVSFPLEAALVSPERTFAPTLLSAVRQSVQEELDGGAGWRLATVNAAGTPVTVLAEGPPQPAPAVTLTLDSGVQRAAQDAVNAVAGKQTVVVALQPSTGDVLAVAQNSEADTEGPIALTGLYPPGSTFKIVTASAALQTGVSAPDAPVDCPGTTVIGNRRIPNYERFDLGTVPLSTAFARSCNTTFAQLATRLGPAGLTDAARQLGLGSDYDVDGITTVTGTVPPAADQVQRAEDGIGQGEVLASPFGMALVAASVARGATPTPTLIAGGTETAVTDAPTPIPPAVVDGLRPMMRAVVTQGTAGGVADAGSVYGKTGEAQFGDGTSSHAWFVGYRGDLAFATLVVAGGSSRNAVAVTAQFLAGLPPA